MKRSEASVKKAVMELLKARGLIFFRMNAGDQFRKYKGKTYRIMGNPSGTADILCFVESRPVWIECKSDSGKQSHEQIQFENMMKMEGHQYWLVRSAAEVEALIEELERTYGKRRV